MPNPEQMHNVPGAAGVVERHSFVAVLLELLVYDKRAKSIQVLIPDKDLGLDARAVVLSSKTFHKAELQSIILLRQTCKLHHDFGFPPPPELQEYWETVVHALLPTGVSERHGYTVGANNENELRVLRFLLEQGMVLTLFLKSFILYCVTWHDQFKATCRS